MKNFILGVFLTIVVVLLAIGVYLLDKQSLSPKKIIEIITPTPVEEVSPTATPTIEATPTVKTTSDNELIKQVLFKKNNWPENDKDFVFQISTNDGKYASGTVTNNGGGGYFYAVKDDTNWVIVTDGNGMIECSSLTKYPDYPVTLIPECYDPETEIIIKR